MGPRLSSAGSENNSMKKGKAWASPLYPDRNILKVSNMPKMNLMFRPTFR
jgi:hypothetical protein